MIETISGNSEFREGEEVVLARGSYTGTLGIFLRLREDPRWADITERDGSVRRHPVEWLAHPAPTTPERNRTAA